MLEYAQYARISKNTQENTKISLNTLKYVRVSKKTQEYAKYMYTHKVHVCTQSKFIHTKYINTYSTQYTHSTCNIKYSYTLIVNMCTLKVHEYTYTCTLIHIYMYIYTLIVHVYTQSMCIQRKNVYSRKVHLSLCHFLFAAVCSCLQLFAAV